MNSRIVTAVGVSVLSAGIMANSGGGAPAGAAVQTPNASDACSRLVGARLGSPHTEITAAEQIASPFAAPDNARSRGVSVDTPFCRVSGVARPTADSEIRFEVWLPPAEAWNGRFRGVGAGGSTGAISYGPMSTSVTDGYAVVATDNGHTSTSGFDGSWSLGHPQRVVDFGYRAQHEATVAGKAVTARYYGRAADYAYFVGCSQGGHHALMEAQRYPDDYDGIVAGAPANYWTGLMAGELWSGLASLHDPASNLPDDKLPMLGAAVLAACDEVDGLADGLIDDPRKCDVDVAALECANGDDTDCLTAAEVEAVEKIYEGPRNPRTGERIYPGYPPGSEYFASPGGIGGWGPFWAGIAEPGGSSNDFMKYTVFRDPDYDVRTFDFDRDWALVNEQTGRRRHARVGAQRHRRRPVAARVPRRQAPHLSRVGRPAGDAVQHGRLLRGGRAIGRWTRRGGGFRPVVHGAGVSVTAGEARDPIGSTCRRRSSVGLSGGSRPTASRPAT